MSRLASASLLLLAVVTAACGGRESAGPAPTPVPIVNDAPIATPVPIVTAVPTPVPTLPPGKMSRGDFAVELIKAKYGETFDVPADPFFFDVRPDDPRYKYIQRFRGDQLTNGCTVTTFCPEAGVNRFGLATFLVRAKLGEKFPPADKIKFTDVAPSHVNLRYMQKAVAEKLMKPCREGAFCPDDLPSAEEIRAAIRVAFPKK